MIPDAWKTESTEQQKTLSAVLGYRIWDMYELPADRVQLWQNIAFALYGSPRSDAEDFGLSEEQKETVTELQDKCVKYSQKGFTDVYIAFIYTCVYRSETFKTVAPVIRVRRKKEDTSDEEHSYFIDHVGRVYNTWNDYLSENTWNVSWICVPAEGIYSNNGLGYVEFYDQTTRGEANTLDTVFTFAGKVAFGTVVFAVILSFTPAAPFSAAVLMVSGAIGAPSGIYKATKGVSGLRDRSKHDQSISLRNAEATQLWIDVITPFLSAFKLGKTGILAGLGITKVTLDVVGILNNADALIKKGEVTPLEAFQFASEVLFFTHSILTFETASKGIADAQSKYNNLPARSGGIQSKNLIVFKGNRQFIKTIGNIDDLHDLGIDE